MEVKHLSSGDRGLARQCVITASSAADLSKATGLEIPDSGSGTYLAAFWGEKRTGGYSITFESARLSGARITVCLALREPLPEAFVTQALTYPYAVAFLPDVSRKGKNFVPTREDGKELGWPVSDASGD